jgi:hypothetical protein
MGAPAAAPAALRFVGPTRFNYTAAQLEVRISFVASKKVREASVCANYVMQDFGKTISAHGAVF